MKTLDDETKSLIDGKCCAVCKYCFYTGLPGAYGCAYHVFIDLFDTCEKWEQKEDDENA